MSKIEINFSNVASATATMEQGVKSNFDVTVATAYDDIITSMEKSSGEYITALKEQIAKEKELTEEVARFFTDILHLIAKASNDYEETDIGYQKGLESQNIGVTT